MSKGKKILGVPHSKTQKSLIFTFLHLKINWHVFYLYIFETTIFSIFDVRLINDIEKKNSGFEMVSLESGALLKTV